MSSEQQQQNPFQGTTAQERAVKEVDYALKIEFLCEKIDQFLSSKPDNIRLNRFIVDFFNGMKKNLGDYHLDHVSRIEFNSNLVKIFDELILVLSLFTYDTTGNIVPIVQGLITGTTHNDYYKLTMAPVIAWAESVMNGTVNVCFGTDIREDLLAMQLLENHNGIRVDVIQALHRLAGRRFNPDIVKQAVSGKSIQGFWEQHSERIFGTEESPNTLIGLIDQKEQIRMIFMEILSYTIAHLPQLMLLMVELLSQFMLALTLNARLTQPNLQKKFTLRLWVLGENLHFSKRP